MAAGDGVPAVLFLCVHNAGARRGTDITDEVPKPWTEEIEQRVRDLLVELGVRVPR
jgi:hypothetical protein